MLHLTDQFIGKIEDIQESEESCDLSDSQLIGLYYHLCCEIEGTKYGIADISEELDSQILHSEILKRSKNDPEFVANLKVKSFFDLFAIQIKKPEMDFKKVILAPFLAQSLLDFLPEEIVILCRQLKRYAKTDPDFVGEIAHNI